MDWAKAIAITLLLNLLLQPDWSDYKHLYVFVRSLHREEYRILRKDYEDVLSKKQVPNMILRQNTLPPLETIGEYNGVPDGSVKAVCYHDGTVIPDPTELNVEEKNLLILDDCFTG